MGHSEALRGVMDGSAWDEFCEHLRRAGHSVIEAAPDDALDRAEGLRYVGRIAKHALQSFIEQSDPAAPVISGLPKLGGDNPDYVYASAPLSAAHEYRLRGNVGDAHYLGFGSYSGEVGTEEGLRCSGYLGGTDIVTDAQGDFEIVVSSEARPRNWLPMQPDTTQLMVRQTVADRRNQRPASFEIERTDGAWTSGPLDPVGYAGQLARAGSYVEGAIAQFLGWTRRFASRPNEIRRLDSDLAAGAQGDPFTHYYAGYYQITEDQTLVIDLQPPACDYWNLQLCNHWLESLDFWNHTIHVNHQTALADDEGSVRVLVSARDPGAPNWLDTASHSCGGIFLRWVGTDRPTEPVCRVIKTSEVSA
jgi:hypothetical protein